MTTTSLPSVYLGWQVVDPGDPPLSRLIDQVPDTDDPQRHRAWRAQVEADNHTLAQHHARHPVWFPVPRPSGHHVVPLVGGTPSTWQAAISTLTAALVRGGFARVRVANLSRWNALDRLHRLSDGPNAKWSTVAATVSPKGSSADVFGLTDTDSLTSVIADTLRATNDQGGRLSAGSVKQLLLDVAGRLQPPITVDRLSDALSFALDGRPPPGTTFAPDERTALQDLHTVRVKQRRHLEEELDRLHGALESLKRFGRDPSLPVRTLGRGEARVRTFEVDTTGAIHEFEIGREVLAHFVTRAFNRPSARGAPEALIVAGADDLPEEILDSLIGSASRYDHQLFLLLGRLKGIGENVLGAGGRRHAVFLRLPNHEDADLAARFLGREYKFVINGYSIAEGQSIERSSSSSVSSDQNTSRALSFGRDFSRTVTRGFSSGVSETSTSGTSQSSTSTTNTGRVHEYVIEPEQFQQLPETAMLIVNDKEVTLADCEPSIRAQKNVATSPYRLPS